MARDKGARIIEKAKSFGASLAGIASIDRLKASPSYVMHEKAYRGIDGVRSSLGIADISEVKWPGNAGSAIVVALSHPHEKPELDWYLESGRLPGNEILLDINRNLSAWIVEELGIKTHHVNYWVGLGGIYLKDLAVLSGLGCIGKNNLVITPEFGPRVRFLAMLVDSELTPTEPIDFDPCGECEEFCHKVCPQNAFDEMVFSSAGTRMTALPGRNGSFSRVRCSIRSRLNTEESGISATQDFWLEKKEPRGEEMGTYQTQKHIHFCRRCELSCPVGG